MKITSETIRQTLPGQRIETVLVSEVSSGNKIVMVTDIRGLFNELITVQAFWLIKDGKTYVFETLDNARLNW
jgi:hypothetical protein